MRRILIGLLVVLWSIPAFGQTVFTDAFRHDGPLGGKWAALVGIWNVQSGTLVQTWGGDSNITVLPMVLTTQTAEVSLYTHDPGGYGGLVFWRQATDANAIWIRVYPDAGGLSIIEGCQDFDGGARSVDYGGSFEPMTWYRLRIEADSGNGLLSVWVNDRLEAMYATTTPYRSGLTGLFSGNSGGGFDDFAIRRGKR